MRNAFVLVSAVLAVACGDFAASDVGSSWSGSPGAGATEFGATQGGVQDMNTARELIAEGVVPPPEAFLVEAMFSEHDLPVDGPACESLLCLRGAAGIADTTEGDPAAWLQVGMSSTIDPATYERPSLTIVATVDVSGSMGWRSALDTPSPGQLARRLLGSIAAELGPQDRIAIVTYGSTVDTWLPLRSATDPSVGPSIDSLGGDGATNMEAGLERAFEIGSAALDGATDQVRVLLFTDVQPNVGATEATAFETMVGAAGDEGIGTTVFALGVGLSPENLRAMSHLRGGNAFSLHAFPDVPALMEDSWPWMVSPIAYDLRVHIQPTSGFGLAAGYGFPETTETEASLEVSTVFLSRRRGALLLRFAPGAEVDPTTFGVAGSLSYERLDGERVHQSLEVSLEGAELDDRGQTWQQAGVQKTVALAQLVAEMRRAAEAYRSSREDAVAILEPAVARFAADAESLADPALDPELALAESLLELMRAGGPQGTLYGS